MGQLRQYEGGFRLTSDGYVLTALNQYTVRVVHKDCRVILHVNKCAKGQSCRFNRGGRGRDPTGSFSEKSTSVGIGECDWSNASLAKLFEYRVLPDDLEKCFVREPLLVIPNCSRCVYTGQNRCLPGSTLRSSLYTKARVGRYHYSFQESNRLLILKNVEWCRVKIVERILWTS